MTFSRTELALFERALIRYQTHLGDTGAVASPLDNAIAKLLKRVERALLDDATKRYAKGDNQFAPQAPRLNAVGKPFSPSYDPKYRIKHRVSTAHLFKPYGPGIKLTSWDA